MNDRLKDINNLVESIKSQKNYEKSLEEKANKIKEKYLNELEGFQLVKSKEELDKCKSGGYIRYINSKNELRYGGLLLKTFKPIDKDIVFIMLQNSNNKKWSITWERNLIFYKNQVKKGDKLRSLFISMLDK